MNQATKDFIRQHQDDDVRQLAFLGPKYPEVDLPFALDQIRGRKMARIKLPRWAAVEGVVYPPHISMEQCSSEATALYKARLAARLLGLPASSGNETETESKKGSFERENLGSKEPKNGNFASENIKFVDLTGGFGVDFSYIAAQLGVRSMYVERQAHLCEAAKANFELLGLSQAMVRNADGVEVLHSLGAHDGQASASIAPDKRLQLIFIDPARRDDAGHKVVSLQDCTPDVTRLQDELLAKAHFVVVKLSPMLDWHRAADEMKCVREVHIVSVGNECKELLLVLSADEITTFGKTEPSNDEEKTQNKAEIQSDNKALKVFCVNDDQQFSFIEGDEASVSVAQPAHLPLSDGSAESEEQPLYLYEPNASLMKAGCFGAISQRYSVEMLASNSHLFVSRELRPDFPGRTFRVRAITSFNKKLLKRHLAGLQKANIATRNFPLSVPELRKRLKLKEGGDTYLFATTLSDGSHVLLVTEKV